ncbi:hypothetical protein KVR01_013472 [Diaporthe batatas]|uniref:uncharacterized protein n=1 Tax=Diaporthe batatas TaxID=748121 RepID=UPI001D03C1C3|nr:uncharacterized protein KVR01_013472 [Diaporthe batatas]KAG8156681.1 hypothetical protein KVR01_013472 [Diaporthe batatas]
MKLRLLLTAVALVPATLARSWGSRDDSADELDVEDQDPVKTPIMRTHTVWTTVEAESAVTVSTVVFVEHLYTTPGISTWENFSPDGYASTTTTFTTTTLTHIPHVVYQTSTLPNSHHVAIDKRSTVSITDWVTVTEGSDNPEVTTERSGSSETTTSTSTPLDAPQTPPSWATAATSTASSSSSIGPNPFNVSSSISATTLSVTSAVSGAPPINSSVTSKTSKTHKTSKTTPTTSTEPITWSRSTSLIVPPVPVTPTAPIPPGSMTVTAGSHSTSNSTSHHVHLSTLTTLSTGFEPPESSTITFIMASHEGTVFSSTEAMATGKEGGPPERNADPGKENIPPKKALVPMGDGPFSIGDEVAPSLTVPFTITLTSVPAITPPPTHAAGPGGQVSVRCDNSWCSDDGIVYCMRWDGSSGIDSWGFITPGEVFTTVGLCTPPQTAQGPVQVSTLAGESSAPAVSRHGPRGDRIRLV